MTSSIQFWPVASQWAPLWYALLFFPKWWACVLYVLCFPTIFFFGKWAAMALIICGSLQLILFGGWRYHFNEDDTIHSSLRVLTLNAGEGLVELDLLDTFIRDASVDVIALQELPAEVDLDTILVPSDWSVLRREKLVVASRYPIEFVSLLSRSDIVEGRGYGLVYMTFDVLLPDRKMRIMNVHLETPRSGLEPFLNLDFDLENLRNNFRRRSYEVGIVAADAKHLGVSIVCGDFNMPEQSPLYRAYFSDYVNAFGARGTGLGATKYTSCYSVRIDHILISSSLKPLQVRVGSDLGSDHRPIVADLALIE
ncbi:endonuclease/exonuclease/phosphatase family protein [Coraliomargarita sp. SDUM461003]|uniref:Endonuclease/exonuclease/phosphatase family protein n=1 Tax=Thalassobacterium maritimum TaxID=3041265 RepID=A0ABU1AWL2_9BACT|nr:endonuclease/exonuclease/phosphatase family protein [Coraliomargarita sp. SDUM461003]MDQ8208542.1 endonuclease/exonuclease/phosphatase family protein [Coraliomargarita sp. SDUM461003]